MDWNSHLKDILIVDVSLMSGLLILISLFPVGHQSKECDFAIAFRSALTPVFYEIASFAFVFLAVSAFLSFRLGLGIPAIRKKQHFEKALDSWDDSAFKDTKWKKRVATFPYWLTLAGLLILVVLAYYLVALNLALPNSAGCFYSASINEKIGLSDILRTN